MNVLLRRSGNGVLEARCEAPSWNDFLKIVRHVKKEFGGRVVDKSEGPDARAWRLRVAGKDIVVHQWDIGELYIFANDAAGEDVVARLAESLKQLGQ